MPVPQKITASHKDWFSTAIMLQRILVVLGILAVGASVLVATLTQELGFAATRISAAVAAISIGVISFFRLPRKISDLWAGWRRLNVAIILFEEGVISVEKLVDEYRASEQIVGVMEANTASVLPESKKEEANQAPEPTAPSGRGSS
jgi:hypothetical protein